MQEMNINKELSVVVIPHTVYLHETDINLKISKDIGREIYNQAAQDDFYAIALAVKEDNANGLYLENDFYRIGTLIKIVKAKEMKDFFHLKLEVRERVEIETLKEERGNYRSTYRLIPDINDLDEGNQEEMLKHIRSLVIEISENFKGSKTYVEKVNQLDNITQAIAYIFPYMRLSQEERQAFLEIRSLKEKSLKFLDILIEQKESIKFQMEMAAKFNEEMNKNTEKICLKNSSRLYKKN